MSRMVRVESLLKEEIARIIQKDFRSNLGLISIMDVKVSKDLLNATVFYSHLGSESEQRKSYEKLRKSTSFIKKELGKTIRLKRIPSLTFRLDLSLERGSNILDKMKSFE